MAGDSGTLLGTAVMDLSHYAMKNKSQDRLPVTLAEHRGTGGESYIEVNVTIKSDDDIMATISFSQPMKAGNTRTGELEEDPHRQLTTIESEIGDIKRMNEDLQAQLALIHAQKQQQHIRSEFT